MRCTLLTLTLLPALIISNYIWLVLQTFVLLIGNNNLISKTHLFFFSSNGKFDESGEGGIHQLRQILEGSGSKIVK